jgi:hypothetical protein
VPEEVSPQKTSEYDENCYAYDGCKHGQKKFNYILFKKLY